MDIVKTFPSLKLQIRQLNIFQIETKIPFLNRTRFPAQPLYLHSTLHYLVNHDNKARYKGLCLQSALCIQYFPNQLIYKKSKVRFVLTKNNNIRDRKMQMDRIVVCTGHRVTIFDQDKYQVNFELQQEVC